MVPHHPLSQLVAPVKKWALAAPKNFLGKGCARSGRGRGSKPLLSAKTPSDPSMETGREAPG
jgi:hypothetical protein